MTNFQKIAGGLFLAARAGRGGGLLILPFFLMIAVFLWAVTALGNLLVGAISRLTAERAR